MFLGIISDTHGNAPLVFEAVHQFKKFHVSQIIHCGDIGTAEVVRLFTEIPTDFVFGNCDTMRETLKQVILESGQKCHGDFGSLTREGKKIAFLHGHQQRRFQTELESGNWDLICFGHSHQAEFSTIGKTYILNPGALYRVITPTAAILQVPEMEIRQIPLV
ncbi:MAG: YfcE family phosphodiesterase [Planctomycetaceae bacterium]|jgi:putative phosphoesterase|nr:YfcE family phosphodiesterase [Planctomycetaceae bacterium]